MEVIVFSKIYLIGWVFLTAGICSICLGENLVDVETRTDSVRANYGLDGTDEAGQKVKSGLYLHRMQTGRHFVQTRKMLLLR